MSLPILRNRPARRHFIARHRLSACPEGLDLLIHDLGFVQVDSINTVERAHHMILSSRQKRYRPRQLTNLLESDRTLFEHWTHDAAVIPVTFFPYWQLRFRRDSERLQVRWQSWRRAGFEEKFSVVLDHVARNGPVMARDVGTDEPRGSGGWWDWHPSKTALEFLWRTGKLSVCRREGFQKVYDLTERVIPADILDREISEAETIEWACASALDRLGFATSGEIAAFWDLVTPAEAKAWCARHLGDDLIEVEVEGHDGTCRRSYARPDLLNRAAADPEPPGSVRVLSPFDPMLRDRARAERLFGFYYRIEVFVPEAKRIYGYYVFPLLEQDRLIGRVDMKRDGAGGPLVVRALWLEHGVKPGKGRLERIDTALRRVALVSGCEDVRYSDGWLRDPLG